MRWLVGIDLGTRGAGALQMARWLRRTEAQECDGAHVFDPELRPLLRQMMVERTVAAARAELHDVNDELGAPTVFSDLAVLVADSPEDALAHRAVALGHDALMIGRVAASSSGALVRLGRVARRLLRSLPVPVAVVPPDLTCEAVGRGGIVLATDLTASSRAAAVFARRLATELRRELIVVHVDVPGARTHGRGQGEAQVVGRRLDDLDAWMRSQALDGARARCIATEVVDGLVGVAREEDTPMLVCGSRLLSLAHRIFTTSVGTELARHAERTVVVIPSDERIRV